MKPVNGAQRSTNAESVVLNVNCRARKQAWAIGMIALTMMVFGLSHVAAAASFIRYQHAGAAHAQGNATLRHGILILAVPTLVLFALIAAIVYKRRNVSR